MLLQSSELKDRLKKILCYESMGDTRIYNYLIDELGSHEKTAEFMVNELGYETWFVNKIAYKKKYNHLKYQQKIQLNRANNI